MVEVEKTWEDALKHCNEIQTNLTSVLSEPEHLTAQRVMQKFEVTERVWIGLRYLVDRWLWVNGDPLVYQAWPQDGAQDHQCPMWKRCGALTKQAEWENWDCQDRLNFICI
ncbi:dromaiocalcin-1-like [Dicentrarchus labrax]|nr:dromaiocalcin-1-like [Dicentrarchus labrax]